MLLLLLLVVVVLGIVFIPANPQPRGPKATDLLTALIALRSELEGPGLDVATAATVLGTADRALVLVRDEIGYSAYRGRWSGARGTLRLGTANTTDKAVLLAALGRRALTPRRAVDTARFFPPGVRHRVESFFRLCA